MVQNWLDRKNRKKLPKTQGTKGSIATTAEAAVPLNNTIEVADVSVQTDVLEEDAQEEVQHQVEEVSPLLDISPGLQDSDYDSAFESDTDF